MRCISCGIKVNVADGLIVPKRLRVSRTVIVALPALLVEAGWLIYCRLMERTTYLTTNLSTSFTADYSLTPQSIQTIKSFIRAMFLELNEDTVLGIGFSATTIAVVFIILAWLIYRWAHA